MPSETQSIPWRLETGPWLQRNDAIRIIAPAGPVPADGLQAGVRILEAAGLRARFSDDILRRDRYLAGDNRCRLVELEEALRDTEARAIWAARGGYGTTRLLRALDPALIRDAQKPIIGFSDITALHAAANRMNVVSLHAPVVCSLAKTCNADLDLLWQFLFDGPAGYRVEWATAGREDPAEASGRLVGGNLCVLTHLLGTPFAPRFDDAILFLEDIGERPYRLDRMLTHVELAGVASQVKAVLLGSFDRCEEENAGYTAASVIAEICGRWHVPIFDGFPAGHGARNVPLPLGMQVTVSARETAAVLQVGGR